MKVIKNHLRLEAVRDEGKPEVKSSFWLRNSNQVVRIHMDFI